MKKVLIVIVLIYSGIFSLTFADCYLVYSSKVTSSLGGPGRYGPMSESKCNELKRQQDNVVDSSNVKCECTSGGGSSSGGYSGQNTMQSQMMQGISNAIGEGIRQGMENARLAEEQRAKEAKWKEEEAKKQEKLKNDKARSDWNKLKLKEAQATVKENERANALSQQMESIGGGSNFFGSENAKPQGIVFKPMGNAKYDASKLSTLARAMCSAYFMKQASDTKDLVQVQYYNNQAGKLMAGEMYDEECENLTIPEPPEPKYISSSEEGANLIKRQTITQEIEKDVKKLSEIKLELEKNGEDIKVAEAKKEKADVVIKIIQTKAQTTTPEEQKELNDLVIEANALAVEATAELKKANSAKENLLDEENKIQQGLQARYQSLSEQPSRSQSIGEINEKR